MALKFLNKKGWHTGSLRNIENVWKAEQKHDAEQKKLDELRKQIQDERERAEFRQLQESAGLASRQERLDFLYESGLGVGKGSSEGFKALQAPPKPEASAAAASADAGASSKAAAPGALFEDKPHSANDAWRKLHSDPLLLIRQREQESLARIRNNPVQMATIRKAAKAEKKHKETGVKKEREKKKEHKKKDQHSKKKHGKHLHTASSCSDSDGSTEQKEVWRERDYPTYERQGKNQERHRKGSSRAYTNSEHADIEVRRKRDGSTHGVGKEMKRRYRERSSPEVSKARDEKLSSRAYSDAEDVRKEIDGKRKRVHSRHEVGKEMEWKDKNQSPPKEVSKEMDGRRPRDRNERHVHKRSWNDQHHSGVCSDSDDMFHDTKKGKNIIPSSDRDHLGLGHESRYSSYNHRRAAPKISEEERAARLQEMQLNAELHEEQRWKRLKNASEADAQEANKDKLSLGGRNFLHAAQKSIYGTKEGGSSTIEESIRRRTYFSQGGTAASESNAFRR